MKKYEVFENNFLCASTFFNPEYRDLMMCTAETKARVKKIAKLYMLEYFKTVESSSDSSELTVDSDCSVDSFKMRKPFKKNAKPPISKTEFEQLLKNEFECYASTPWGDSYDQFWCTHQERFPNLSKFARIVLTPPATSCSSERAFSAASNQIWARRNRIATSSVEKLMFLISNLNDDVSLLTLE